MSAPAACYPHHKHLSISNFPLRKPRARQKHLCELILLHKNVDTIIMHHMGERLTSIPNRRPLNIIKLGGCHAICYHPQCIKTGRPYLRISYNPCVYLSPHSPAGMITCITSASAHRVSDGRPQLFLFNGGEATLVC